ncbi:hypothetical protein AWRI3579_g2832 [Hanseniaspora osmophila]|uniref:ATG1-like MIT domain-containing protein n=1 Tax=Hanseniaspora osmophila TaxID=56408 RepID=A0A1E5RBH1_9ASCO|nr:hypothetical protein AWRI3579_g2832 [Hanseniaspora osmophila]
MLESLLDEEPASDDGKYGNGANTVNEEVGGETDKVNTQSNTATDIQSTSKLDSNDQEMIKKYITGIARRLKSLKASTTASQANISLR